MNVQNQKADGRPWDAFDGPPDIALCVQSDLGSDCLPNGSAARSLPRAECSDTFQCRFGGILLPRSPVQVEIVDVDAVSNDMVGTGVCNVGASCSVGQATISILPTPPPGSAAPPRADSVARLFAGYEDEQQGRQWAAAYGDDLNQAWRECPRADWLIWLAGKAQTDRRIVVRAASDCVRLALPHLPPGAAAARREADTAERWATGRATLDQCRAAVAAGDAAAERLTRTLAAMTEERRRLPVAALNAASEVLCAVDDRICMPEGWNTPNDRPFPASAATAVSDATSALALAAGTDESVSNRRCADLIRTRIPNVSAP